MNDEGSDGHILVLTGDLDKNACTKEEATTKL